MRPLIKALCAVALAACSESKAPTAIQSPVARVSVGDSIVRRPSNPQPSGAFDARTPVQRVEDMMTGSLTKVRLPADGFSLSPDAVHPDIACPPEHWNAERCWLMYTPYLNSDNTYENPGFLSAGNDTTWNTPAGVLNPIVPYPGFGKYNSDPDHAFDPGTHRLVQMYRVVADGFNSIMIMSTGDARHWTTPSVAFREPNHDAISPALIIDPDRTAKVWYVRSGTEGCQSRSTSVQLRTARPDPTNAFDHAEWSPPTPVDMSIPNASVWHLDVAPLGDGRGYIALIAAYQNGWSCSNSNLWLATSPDGLHWRTYAIPILWLSMKIAAQRNMSTWYRGTLRYDAETDSLHLWPSALVGRAWTIYHAATSLRELLGVLESAVPSDARSLATLTPSRVRSLRAIEMP
jgi:hypothetical protein